MIDWACWQERPPERATVFRMFAASCSSAAVKCAAVSGILAGLMERLVV
jgi:hypothetical protein